MDQPEVSAEFRRGADAEATCRQPVKAGTGTGARDGWQLDLQERVIIQVGTLARDRAPEDRCPLEAGVRGAEETQSVYCPHGVPQFRQVAPTLPTMWPQSLSKLSDGERDIHHATVPCCWRCPGQSLDEQA